MKIRLSLIYGLISLLTFDKGYLAWSEQVKSLTDPPLSQVFPLDQKIEGVRVKFPVLINENTIVGPDAILKTIYNTSPTSSDVALGVDPTVDSWSRVDLFATALDHAQKRGTMVVYGYESGSKPITTPLDPPDGMFLGEEAGKVEVLTLIRGSQAMHDGVLVGDQIISFQRHVTVDSLQSFMVAYLTTRQAVQAAQSLSYTMEVWRPSQASQVTIQMVIPSSSFPRFH